jgi:hypothetical protein
MMLCRSVCVYNLYQKYQMELFFRMVIYQYVCALWSDVSMKI